MIPETVHERAERLSYHMMNGNRFEGIHEARRYMGERWANGEAMIPKWVTPCEVELDLAYTAPHAAKSCVEDIMECAKGCRFIEPSAGQGAFLEWLPDDTIAMDVLPKHPKVMRGEFLTYEPPEGGPYCIAGAPPFGDNLWLTNTFTMHALDIAKWVGFITDAKALRKMPNGNMHHAVPLGSDAMRGLSGGPVRRELEWRVWTK